MPPDIASWIPSTLLGAPLLLLGLLSAGVRAGCSGLQVPRGGPGGATASFSQSAHLPQNFLNRFIYTRLTL